MCRLDTEMHALAGDDYSHSFEQCEALVDQPAWMRLHDSSQCGRSGSPRRALAGTILCWQHERAVERGGELTLTGDRLLVADWIWSENGRREVLRTRILENVVDLQRRKRDQPPPGWEPVTDEQRLAAVKVLGAVLDGQRHRPSEED